MLSVVRNRHRSAFSYHSQNSVGMNILSAAICAAPYAIASGVYKLADAIDEHKDLDGVFMLIGILSTLAGYVVSHGDKKSDKIVASALTVAGISIMVAGFAADDLVESKRYICLESSNVEMSNHINNRDAYTQITQYARDAIFYLPAQGASTVPYETRKSIFQTEVLKGNSVCLNVGRPAADKFHSEGFDKSGIANAIKAHWAKEADVTLNGMSLSR